MNQALADLEAYTGRTRDHEDAIRKDAQEREDKVVQELRRERQLAKAISDQVARQQAASAERLHMATLNTMIQMTAMASRPAGTSAAAEGKTTVGSLTPDAIVQQVDGSLTIALLASSQCSEEDRAGVVSQVKGLGNRIIVKKALEELMGNPDGLVPVKGH